MDTLGKNHKAMLKSPFDEDLGLGARVTTGHGSKAGIFATQLVGARERRVGLKHNAAALTLIHKGTTLKPRMQFDLVDGRRDACIGEEFFKVSSAVVANANAAHAAAIDRPLERLPCLTAQHRRRLRRVHQQQVNVAKRAVRLVWPGVAAQTVERAFNCLLGLSRAVVLVPDFGRVEDVSTCHAVGIVFKVPQHAFAGLALVVVNAGGVNVAVAHAQRGFDNGRGGIGCGLVHAQANGGNGVVGIELDHDVCREKKKRRKKWY